MTLDIDIAGDFAAITDWQRSVMVDDVQVDAALRRAVTSQEIAMSGGQIKANDTVFHLDAAEHELVPKLGSQIVDYEALVWTVIQVQWQTFVRRWRCTCRQVVIGDGDATNPNNLVSVQRATMAKGTTGALEPTWSTIASNLMAAVQYQTTSVDVENDNRHATSVVRVFFAKPFSLKPSDRINAPGGAILKVVGWNGFDPMEGYFTATCEVTKWPQA